MPVELTIKVRGIAFADSFKLRQFGECYVIGVISMHAPAVAACTVKLHQALLLTC